MKEIEIQFIILNNSSSVIIWKSTKRMLNGWIETRMCNWAKFRIGLGIYIWKNQINCIYIQIWL